MYEPYPTPEISHEHKNYRYSSLWDYAKQDLRILLFFLIIASLVGFGIGHFWGCIAAAFILFVVMQLRALYLVNDWIANRPYEVPPNLNGIWGALLFNIYRSQRQERVVQAEMVGLIDRAQSIGRHNDHRQSDTLRQICIQPILRDWRVEAPCPLDHNHLRPLR